MTRHVIVKLESYEGDDTFVRCGDDRQDFLFTVVAIEDSGAAEIVDGGYRSFEEALESWPDAQLRPGVQI